MAVPYGTVRNRPQGRESDDHREAIMNDERVLQPVWDFLSGHLGGFLASPGFLLTAVVLGIYLPGVVFSAIDVAFAKRLTWQQCWGVYWRAMRWYGPLYVVALAVFIAVPLPFALDVPTAAPTGGEFTRDLVLYFLVGDFCSYWWHRFEHQNRWYARRVHRVHHVDQPPLTIWTAMVVHPVEGFSVFVLFHLYGIVFPIHLFTFAVAAFAMTAVTMITHCGYRMPVYDSLFATAAGHDLHHSIREPTNISVVLSVCDRLFGTYQKASYRPSQGEPLSVSRVQGAGSVGK
jgi:sterol desaturase/sphingolipid hydroxylase (fatty acid hydroxylase superfamily)